ncbi:MAG TPA: GNAT family N-acetyltransferase [Candidatus Dormibacteraeota bacterium]|nr:GNAT family N-acetyltransferase [Candidatus Dormibacteraeota bacterium]
MTVRAVDISVRPARPGDGAGLARAWLEAGRYYASLNPDLFQVPEEEGLSEHFERALATSRPDLHHVVAEVGDRIVGSAVGRLEPALSSARYQLQRHLGHRRLVVDAVVVEERFRGRGVGTRLMNALEEWGRRRGATLALLDTYPESALSLPFFEERAGYHRRSVRLFKGL